MWKSCCCFFTDSKQHKARKLDMTAYSVEIVHCGHTWHGLITHDGECPNDIMILKSAAVDDVTGADYGNSPYAFDQSEQR